MDDERPNLDPRRLLPFTCILEPDDPSVQRLPAAFVGTDEVIYGNHGV